MTAVCATHPGEAVVGNCTRCGTFICNLDSKLVDAQLYCATCAARPDVDWIEGFRLQHWGKRDGWAWLFGIGAPVQLAAGISLLLGPETRVFGLFAIGAAVGGALWWLRIPHARWALIGLLVAQAAWGAVVIHPAFVLGTLIPLIILVAVSLATPTKLFFQQPVSRDELRRMWNLLSNNQLARHALSIGILGLLVWPVAPIAIICGAIGLSRVNPDAKPPIGRKGSAIAGIVLGAIGVCIGTGLVVAGLVR